MAATVTLSTTTLSEAVSESTNRFLVASTDGLTAGTRIFLDRELAKVVSLDVGTWVNVARGVDGTAGAAHSSGVTVYIGRADQFYSQDPGGRPAEAIPVSPHINVLAGNVWFAQGDSLPGASRWWQKQTVTYSAGALGVSTTTLDPTSST